MATQLQLRSGTTLQNDMFTGAPGELTYDTEKHNIRIHDGVTVGGVQIADSGTADYVIEWQRPTEENGYTWYRKYASGWVEQGGVLSGNSITFPVEFLVLPTVVFGSKNIGTDSNAVSNKILSLTTTGFTGNCVEINAGWNATKDMSGYWQASGQAA